MPDDFELALNAGIAAYADRIEQNFIHSLWMEHLFGGLWARRDKLHGVPWGDRADFTTALCENGPHYDHGIMKARGMIHAHLARVLKDVADEWGVDLHAGCDSGY